MVVWSSYPLTGHTLFFPSNHTTALHIRIIIQCSSWNYGQDFECHRCRAAHHHHSSSNNIPYDEQATDNEQPEPKTFAEQVDEFGRAVSRAISKKTNARNDRNIWPPSFDKNGSAFVFDTRSGMFYESKTDFFYDPVSKLYYGNKQSIYYRYDNEKKVFEEVQKVDSTKTDEALAPTPIMELVAKPSAGSQEAKPTISIKLKTTSLGSAKAQKKGTKSKIKTVEPAPRVVKQHAADLAKWSERQAEKRQEQEKDVPMPAAEVTIATTAKGEPICLLCRRKFPTLAKLEYHNKASALHKENVAKERAKEVAAASKQDSPCYMDRAQQRRTMYGPETSAVVAATDLQSLVNLGSQSSVPVAPQDSLGESNIGNQMLQKLGWKDGAALGRNSEESGDSVAAGPGRVASSVQQEWDRIEVLAALNGGKANRPAGGIGSHHGT